MNKRSQTNKKVQTIITDNIESKIGKYQHELIAEKRDKMEKRSNKWIGLDSKIVME